MDASPDTLAETVRAKRAAIDRDLERLRVRLSEADPRRRLDVRRTAARTLAVFAGLAGVWIWARRRRRVQSLEQLLVHGLADLYEIEHRLLPALDRMHQLAWSPDVEQAFAEHRLATEGHIDRLERVFRSIGRRARRGSSAAVDAILDEGKRLLSRKVDRDVRDAWMIATAQRLEHLEIANYGTMRSYAQTLGFTFAAQLLQQTLEEERAADEKLTRLAERFVNPESTRTSHAL